MRRHHRCVAPSFPPLSFLACFVALIAGAAVARRSELARAADPSDPATGAESLLIALGIALGMVPTAAFYVYLAAGVPVRAISVMAIAFVVAAVAIATTPRSAGKGLGCILPIVSVRAFARRRWPVLVAVSAVGVFAYARYGGPLSTFTCSREAAEVAAGVRGVVDLLRGNVGDARLGNVGVMSGAAGLFGTFHLLFVGLAMLTALSGWVIGTRCGASCGHWRTASGWLGLTTLALNPWILSIPRVEENVLASSFAAIVVALAVVRRPPWLLLGAFFGLVFSMRHPLILAAPGIGLLAFFAAHRVRALAAVTSGALALSLVEHLHHKMAFGSVFAFESNPQFPSLPYELFGREVSLRAMMNWPVYDNLVRTPHNPYPMLVGWWLHLADHLGLVLFSLALVGGMWMWRRQRLRAAMVTAWWVPVFAIVALQEAWDHPNKMGVLTMILPAWAAMSAAGVDALSTQRKATIVAWAAVLLASWAAVAGVRSWHVPADGRYYSRYSLPEHESATWVAYARDVATSIAPWPDFGRTERHVPLIDGEKVSPENYEPTWGWFDRELLGNETPVTLELDLSAPLFPDGPTVRVSDKPADIDLTIDGEHGASVDVDWEPQPLIVTATRGPRLGHIEVAFSDYAAREPGCDPRRMHCKCRNFDNYERGAGKIACIKRHPRIKRRSTIRIKAPMSAVSLTALINPVGHVVQLWKLRMIEGSLTVSAPILYWHD